MTSFFHIHTIVLNHSTFWQYV